MVRTAFVVDLDHTLIGANTTFELLQILCPVRYFILSKILKPLTLLNVVLKRDIYKLVLITICVKGWRREKLEQLARTYYEMIVKREPDTYLNNRLLLFLHKMRSTPKILLTASLDFIADNFKKLGLDLIISSRSYYKNDKFHSFQDLYKQKNHVLMILLKYFDKVVVFDDDPEPEFYTLGDRVIVVRLPAHGKRT